MVGLNRRPGESTVGRRGWWWTGALTAWLRRLELFSGCASQLDKLDQIVVESEGSIHSQEGNIANYAKPYDCALAAIACWGGRCVWSLHRLSGDTIASV